MSKTPPRKRGRPKRAGADTEPVTFSVPLADLQLADDLIGPLSTRALGLPQGRADVLRAALAIGLRSMREQLAAT